MVSAKQVERIKAGMTILKENGATVEVKAVEINIDIEPLTKPANLAYGGTHYRAETEITYVWQHNGRRKEVISDINEFYNFIRR